jgi:DNA-binding NarL/FixJ family response regulator
MKPHGAPARGDARVPFEEGRFLAGLIPGARFVPLESRNHVLLEHEPAFAHCFGEIRSFLGEQEPQRGGAGAFPTLTPRERELVELLAHGLDNLQIAAHLGLSEKTVRNKVSAVFDKLDAPTRAQAIVRAREAGFGRAPLPH